MPASHPTPRYPTEAAATLQRLRDLNPGTLLRNPKSEDKAPVEAGLPAGSQVRPSHLQAPSGERVVTQW